MKLPSNSFRPWPIAWTLNGVLLVAATLLCTSMIAFLSLGVGSMMRENSLGAMGQLNQATQQNASASEELAATAEELDSQDEQLQQTMTFFRLA